MTRTAVRDTHQRRRAAAIPPRTEALGLLGRRLLTRWPLRLLPTGRIAATAVIAVVVLGGLTACSGGSPTATGSGVSPNAETSSASPSVIAYSGCLRSHGVPKFPDPTSNGQVPKTSAQAVGVSSTQLQLAEQACQRLYPSSGSGVLTKNSIGQCEETGDCPQALVESAMSALRSYAQCVRAHGLPTWPDPSLDSEGRPGFNLLHVQGFDPNSSQTSNVMQECYHVMRGVPVPVTAPGRPG